MRRVIIFSLMIVWLATCTTSNAKPVDRNFQELESWSGICADGTMFVPRWRETEPESFREAAREYARHPDNETWFYRACPYYESGRREQSLEAFCKTALAKHPSWAAPHYYLAKAAQKNIEDDMALLEFKKAYELMPCWGHLARDYSSILNMSGKHKECISVVDQTLKYRATEGGARWLTYGMCLNKGKSLVTLHKTKEAAAWFDKLPYMKEFARDPVGNYYACQAYRDNGEWKKVIEHAKILIAVTPQDAIGHLCLAQGYAGMAQYEPALTESTKFLKQGGEMQQMTPAAHELRASIFEKLGKKELAVAERQHIQKNFKDMYAETPFRLKPSGSTAK